MVEISPVPKLCNLTWIEPSARRPEGKNILPMMIWLPPLPVDSLPLPWADAVTDRLSKIRIESSTEFTCPHSKHWARREGMDNLFQKDSLSWNIGTPGQANVKDSQKENGERRRYRASPRQGQLSPPI